MKPKWEFVARKVGLEGSWLLVVGLVALGFASIMIFYKRYNPIEWAEFGEIGWRVFMKIFLSLAADNRECFSRRE